jgi:FAD-dependent urate hydroxylase
MTSTGTTTSRGTGTSTRTRTAIVIGGGIAGPVVATALRKAGIEADVYEAYPEPATAAAHTPAGHTAASHRAAGSTPIGSAPAGSAPAGSAPAGSAPAGSAPAWRPQIGYAPAGSAPAGRPPAGRPPAGSAPAGSALAGGALTLAPNGLAALGAIGLASYIEPVGEPTPRMVMETGGGKRLGEIADLPGVPTSRTFARGELHAALLTAARDHGVLTAYGKKLVDFDQGDRRVVARFADGSEVAADVLIGADGIHSVVRGRLDPGAPAPRYVGLLGLGAWIEPDGLAPTGGAMHLMFGRRAFFGYWVTERRAGWFANLASPEPLTAAEARATPAGEWLRRLKELYAEDRGPALAMLDRTDPADLVNVGGMHDLPPVPVWSRGRVGLLGDAVHATSPSSGQGASLAIESAIELARCLRDRPIGDAFSEYERRRRGRVELIIKRTARINNDKAPGPVGRIVRDITFPIAMRTFYRPERMVGWIHRYAMSFGPE